MRILKKLLALSALALLPGWADPAVAIDGAGIRSFSVESEPPGAEVTTITGRHGTTPLTLSERDIYPNSYPPEQMNQYGVVILSKPGCREMNIRPADSDIVNGLLLELDCDRAVASERSAHKESDTGSTTGKAEKSPPSTSKNSDLATRKIEQLRFLQQLLDEGLISAEEEARIRRRILEQP